MREDGREDRIVSEQRPTKGSGESAAPGASSLSLLPSGPDEVRKRPVHRTRTLRQPLLKEFILCLEVRACKAVVEKQRADGVLVYRGDLFDYDGVSGRGAL